MTKERGACDSKVVNGVRIPDVPDSSTTVTSAITNLLMIKPVWPQLI